jgi:26S proteasome regulatory subunit N2
LLTRATNWAKLSAAVGLWVIHQCYLQQGGSLMALPYLPQNGLGGGSPYYSEGDALDVLGLIHVIHGEEGINTVSA